MKTGFDGKCTQSTFWVRESNLFFFSLTNSRILKPFLGISEKIKKSCCKLKGQVVFLLFKTKLAICDESIIWWRNYFKDIVFKQIKTFRSIAVTLKVTYI